MEAPWQPSFDLPLRNKDSHTVTPATNNSALTTPTHTFPATKATQEPSRDLPVSTPQSDMYEREDVVVGGAMPSHQMLFPGNLASDLLSDPVSSDSIDFWMRCGEKACSDENERDEAIDQLVGRMCQFADHAFDKFVPMTRHNCVEFWPGREPKLLPGSSIVLEPGSTQIDKDKKSSVRHSIISHTDEQISEITHTMRVMARELRLIHAAREAEWFTYTASQESKDEFLLSLDQLELMVRNSQTKEIQQDLWNLKTSTFAFQYSLSKEGLKFTPFATPFHPKDRMNYKRGINAILPLEMAFTPYSVWLAKFSPDYMQISSNGAIIGGAVSAGVYAVEDVTDEPVIMNGNGKRARGKSVAGSNTFIKKFRPESTVAKIGHLLLAKGKEVEAARMEKTKTALESDDEDEPSDGEASSDEDEDDPLKAFERGRAAATATANSKGGATTVAEMFDEAEL